jgi:hypothetical protein
MGVRTTLPTTAVASSHPSAALKAGRYPAEQIAQAETQRVHHPCVITDCVFTGAAILRKDKAAYRATSIARSGIRH